MKKKVLDFVCGLLFWFCVVGVFGSVGAWETDHISLFRALVQIIIYFGVAAGLGMLNKDLMERLGK